MGGSRFGVLDSEGGWECTELTLAAQKHAEGLNKDGAVTRNNGNGEQLQVHAKFRDPMEMALRCQRETDRAFYRALDKFLKLRAGGARIALEQSGQKNKVE